MVSGTGFKSTSDDNFDGAPRKKMVSRGLLVAFGTLVVVLIVWGALKMWDSSLKAHSADLEQETLDVNDQIQNAMSDDVSDFAVRADAMEKEIYRGYDTNDILQEIEKIMILKESDNSGNRVVLKSFQHNSGAKEKKTVGTASAVITGRGNITISADADSFDVMAQQIAMFKKSTFFDNVEVGTTDRDESGRIIFTLTMDVNGYKKMPFEKNGDAGMNQTQSDTSGSNGVDVQSDGSRVQVDAQSDGSSVQVDTTQSENTSVKVNQ